MIYNTDNIKLLLQERGIDENDIIMRSTHIGQEVGIRVADIRFVFMVIDAGKDFDDYYFVGKLMGARDKELNKIQEILMSKGW